MSSQKNQPKLPSPEIAHSFVLGPKTISIMAISGTQSLGIVNADLHPSKPNHWWLARLKVSEGFQNSGIGSKLLALLKEELEARTSVQGLVVAPGGYGSDVERLEKWYGARGFIKQKGYMLWRPERAALDK